MVQSGNYLYPTFNKPPGAGPTEHVSADKPAMTFWLMSAAVRAFGPSELALRLVGPVGHFFVCLLIYAIGRRLFDARTGMLASVMYSMTLLACLIGTMAMTDTVMMPFNMAVMLFVAKSVAAGGFRLWQVPIVVACFAGAMLTKSPFGLLPLIVFGGMLLTNWLTGRGANVRLVHVLALAGMAVLAGCVYLAWFIPANEATQGLYYQTHVGKHIVGRAAGAMESHGGKGWAYFAYLPYYLVVVFLTFFPWTLLLGGAVSAVLGGRVGGANGKVFLVGWFVPVFVLMTLVSTKLPHYVLFGWPALALAAAGVVTAHEQGKLTDRDRKWLRLGKWSFAPVVFVMAAGGLVGSWFAASLVPGIVPGGVAFGAVALAMGVVGLRQHAREQYGRCVWTLVAGMAGLMLIAAALIVPVIEPLKITPYMGREIKAKVAPDTELVSYNFIEPSLTYYADRSIHWLEDQETKAQPADVADWARGFSPLGGPTSASATASSSAPASAASVTTSSARLRPGAIVIPRDTLTKIEKQFGPLPLKELAHREGFNYSKGKWTDLLLLERTAAPTTTTQP